MKIFLLTDLEGVAGVATFDDTAPSGRDYERSKSLLTGEINAAVTGILATSAADIWVVDGHGCGGINYPELHPEAKWIAGKGIFHALNYTDFDAVLFVGQHARNGAPRAHLNHTMDSRSIVEVKINNVPVGEFGLWAGFFGQMSVPILFLSGDQAACEEARALIPELVTVAVKVGLEREAAVHLSPQKARALIQAGTQSALERRAQIAPLRFTPPFQMTVEYLDTAQAQRQALNKMGQLIHPRIVALESTDYFKLIHYWL